MNRRELERSIQELLDGDQAPGRTTELYEVLAADPEARRCYYQHVALHQSLSFRLARPPGSESSRSLAEARLHRQRRRSIQLSLVTAAAALIMAAFIFRSFLIPPAEPFARLQAANGSLYSITQAAGEESSGTGISEGSHVALRQGTLELEFTSGSRMVVQAPARFRIVSPRRVDLPQGTAYFHVAPPDKGFTVETGELRVVDLGTEFGVVAQPDRAEEVHVLSGRVEITALHGTKSSAKLNAGRANLVDPVGRLLTIPLDRHAFPAALPPGLLDLHFGFDDGVTADGSHPDAATIHSRYLDASGKPASPNLVPGRVGRAIALRGDGDRIATDWPGFAGELPRSVSFWSRIEPGTDLSHLPSIAGWGDPRAPLGKWNVTIANQTRGEPIVARISLGVIAYKGSTPLADGRWHHCVAVFSGNLTASGDPALEIYIDGVRETLTRMEFGKAEEESSGAGTVTASKSSMPLRIGVSIESRPGSFPGLVDELRIHAGALSPEAVAELFAEGD